MTDRSDLLPAAPRRLASMEWICAGVLIAIAIMLHWTTFSHQGALWRDEVNAVEMGRMSLREAWGNLPYDALLMGPVALMHVFALAGLSDNDVVLRAWGMVLGIGVLVAIVWGGFRI